MKNGCMKMATDTFTLLATGKGQKRCREAAEIQSSPSTLEAGCCGICLSDQWKVARGKLDCCDHSFCFVCILEWAKIETRCPACKRRFSSVSRPPRPGVSESLVNVRRRDQVSSLEGNLDYFEPYETIRCTVCGDSGEDNLLLLCDLCDSASHTFCVGLGFTVPEGDWFCHDCSAFRAEYDKGAEDDHECVDQPVIIQDSNCRNLRTVPDSDKLDQAGSSSVCIFDIVHEPDLGNASRTSFSGRMKHEKEVKLSALPEISSALLPDISGMARNEAKSLKKLKKVQARIKDFRENWDSLRRGEITFSSCRSGSSSNTLIRERGGTSTSNSGRIADPQECRYNADKAWKMMDKAMAEYNSQSNATMFKNVLKCPAPEGNVADISRKASPSPSCSNFRNLYEQKVCSGRAKTWHIDGCSSKAVKDAFSPSLITRVPVNGRLLQDYRINNKKKQTLEDNSSDLYDTLHTRKSH